VSPRICWARIARGLNISKSREGNFPNSGRAERKSDESSNTTLTRKKGKKPGRDRGCFTALENGGG